VRRAVGYRNFNACPRLASLSVTMDL